MCTAALLRVEAVTKKLRRASETCSTGASFPLSVRSAHSETHAQLPRQLFVIVSALKTDIDASGRTTSKELRARWSGHLEQIPSQAKCPWATIQRRFRRDSPERERERRTVGRASHNLAGWALFIWMAVVGSMLYRNPTTWNIEADKVLSSLSSDSPSKANIQQCRQGSVARGERLQSEHVQRGDSREYDAHVMSAVWSIRAQDEPHTQRDGSAAVPLNSACAQSATLVQSEFA